MAPITAGMDSLPTLLSSLTTALDSASSVVPEKVTVPENGISLLDIKNELFLSYLQNLVFLILLKIRNQKSGQGKEGGLDDEAVKKLVELRVYLEKGVRPLEGRLKYQIDKVVRAADDAAKPPTSNKASKPANAPRKAAQSDESDEDITDEDASDAEPGASEEVNELAYRPNPAAFARPAAAPTFKSRDEEPSDGIYRPPKINATAMPETRGREERGPRKAMKSSTLDEFIAEEFSEAPRAQPSIGSTIVSGGRRTVSQRERAEQAERQAYEEANLVRLPTESKKERAKKGYDRRGGYGGEDWRDLNYGLDRIDRLTERKGKGDMLGRSRKRSATEDGPRGDGAIGGGFEKRRKMTNRKR